MQKEKNYALLSSTANGIDFYGIKITETDGKTYEYPFVSTVCQTVQPLIDRLSEGDISPLHYDDIISDFIIENAYKLIEANNISI